LRVDVFAATPHTCDIVFLFKCYWYDTTDRVIRVDPHYGLVEINSKARLRNINNVFVFAKQCQQVYYTYTPSFRKDRSRVEWISILKMKPKGRIKVVQDENEDTSVGDEVFQVNELVEPYQVAPSIDLEENSFVLSMIALLMLIQRSWILFWALANKQISMKMMMIISILKIEMELMTNQLTMKKKKILTNYQNQGKRKAFFDNVIYILWMIYCNIKYLFYKC